MKAKKNLQTKSNLTKIRHNKFPVDASQREMRKCRRVFCIYIDGSNFFHSLKNCDIDENQFDYRKFVDWLVGTRVKNVKYYVGEIRVKKGDEKSKKLFNSQQSRFNRLRNFSFQIVKGRIIKIDDKFMEKGVDVRIGIDVAVGAAQNYYEKAFLISSDSDLIPDVEFAIQKANKEIVYVGFEGGFVSHHLIQKSSSAKIVKKAELEKFILKFSK